MRELPRGTCSYRCELPANKSQTGSPSPPLKRTSLPHPYYSGGEAEMREPVPSRPKAHYRKVMTGRRGNRAGAIPQRPLKILSANVQKNGNTHMALLESAFTGAWDIVLIQEPWVGREVARQLTKKYPGYDVYSPVDLW